MCGAHKATRRKKGDSPALHSVEHRVVWGKKSGKAPHIVWSTEGSVG